MAELRQLMRRVTDLEAVVSATPFSADQLAALPSADKVGALEATVADLTQKLTTYHLFVEDVLAKVGLLEQKIVGLEAKVCQCGSEYSVESAEPMTTVVLAENPVFQPETLEAVMETALEDALDADDA